MIAIGRHPSAPREAVEELARIAARYRVELVSLDELEEAGARHGAPLPDTIHTTAAEPEPATASAVTRAPDLTPDDVPRPAAPSPPRGRGLIDPLTRPIRTIGLRARVAFLAVECCVALAFVVLALLSYRSASTTSYVQRHGVRATGYIEAVHHHTCGTPYEPTSCVETSFTVGLTRPVHGVRVLQINYGRYVPAPADRRVGVRVDPRHPHYGELATQARTSAVIWMLAAILAAIVTAATALDAAALVRRRHRHHTHVPTAA